MNILRLYAALLTFIVLIQPSLAQEPVAPAAPLPPLDMAAMCAESPNLCVLAERMEQLEKKPGPGAPCYVVLGQLICDVPWPPPCPSEDGWVWNGSDCVPITIGAFSDRAVHLETQELISRWPYWWIQPPWNIPRPPYPWRNGPLPDPWQLLALQQALMSQSAIQAVVPVTIGTDKGIEAIPDFCLKAEWEEGKIPPECNGLAGLVRKLGLSPEDAPLLKPAQ